METEIDKWQHKHIDHNNYVTNENAEGKYRNSNRMPEHDRNANEAPGKQLERRNGLTVCWPDE